MDLKHFAKIYYLSEVDINTTNTEVNLIFYEFQIQNLQFDSSFIMNLSLFSSVQTNINLTQYNKQVTLKW